MALLWIMAAQRREISDVPVKQGTADFYAEQEL